MPAPLLLVRGPPPRRLRCADQSYWDQSYWELSYWELKDLVRNKREGRVGADASGVGQGWVKRALYYRQPMIFSPTKQEENSL
jgi:hypothetical protein